MQRETGIVMKVDGPNAIVMTADRRFLKVAARSGIRIGQEIEVNKQIGNRSSWTKAGMLAASVALMAAVWQISAYMQPVKATAYIAVDINPSIELSIDKQKDVLQIIPLNDDGKKLIAHLDYKGKQLQKVIAEVTGEAAKQGYIKTDGEILVTASDAGETGIDIASLEKEAMDSVQGTLQQTGLATKVGGVVVSAVVREEAKQLGVSPGKYALYLQAQARQIPVTIDDIKKQSVSAIVEQHGTEIKDIVKNMDGGKKLDQLLSELKQLPAVKQAGDDKKSDPKQDPKDVNKEPKQNNKRPADQNGKKPAGDPTPPVSPDANTRPLGDLQKKLDLDNRIDIPNPLQRDSSGNQDEQSNHIQNSEPSAKTPPSPQHPSLKIIPILDIEFSLHARLDKKSVRSKQPSKDDTETVIRKDQQSSTKKAVWQRVDRQQNAGTEHNENKQQKDEIKHPVD